MTAMDEEIHDFLRRDVRYALVEGAAVVWLAATFILFDVVHDVIPGSTFLMGALRLLVDALVFVAMTSGCVCVLLPVSRWASWSASYVIVGIVAGAALLLGVPALLELICVHLFGVSFF